MKSKIDLGKRIPKSVIPRLSFYYRILVEFKEKYLSSVQLARRAGFTDAQVRRDLAYFGQFGTRGKGYDVDALKQALSEILGIDRTWSVGVIGVGNLGTAFIKYRGFGKQGFNIVAGFDVDDNKIGNVISGVRIYALHELEEVIKTFRIDMIILTVPSVIATGVLEKLKDTGVKGILNFAPIRLRDIGDIVVNNIDLSIELERLSFGLKK